MNRAKFTVLLLFTLNISAFSQTLDLKGTNILDRFDSIVTLKQEFKKAYQAKECADNWSRYLRECKNVPTVEPHRSLKQIVSPDGFITLYYYLLPIADTEKRVSLFAVYTRDSIQRVVQFNEVLPPLPQPKNSINEEIVFAFANLQDTELKSYELKFFRKSTPEQSLSYQDFYLKCLFEEMVLSRDNDEKNRLNEQEILPRMRKIWNEPSLFENPLYGYNRISTIISTDKKVKITTWNVELNDGSHQFYGAVSVQKEGKPITTFELTDKTNDLRSPDRLMLTHKRWYGAIYLDIIHTSYKKQDYYTLIGFKGNNELTKIKLLEVLTIQPNGEPRFGSSILTKGPGYAPRLIFEYSAGANMMMKYDESLKMIVMDNLSPSEPMFKNVFRFYGPDFSYNGYKFEKGKWKLYPDLDLRNPKTLQAPAKPVRKSKIPQTIQQ